MKTHLLKLIVIFFGLTLASCDKENGMLSEIQLDDISFTFNNKAQSQLLEIPINEISNEWHIYSPSQDGWLTQEIIPGRSSIYVYVDGNTTGEARSSYIMIRSKQYTQKVNVHQDSDGGVDLSQSYVPVRYLNSTSQVTIANYEDLTDIAVTSEENTQRWLSIFTEGEKISLSVAINDLTVAREALITVSAKRKISGETVTSFINLYQGRGGMTPYVFDIPDFTQSNVYKVMDDNKQVAQITKEFLRSVGLVNAQAIVVYPVENDVVSINKGYVAQIVLENTDLTDATYTYGAPTAAVHGGTVSFSIANNNISGYAAGTLAAPVTKIYMPGDVGLGPDEVPGSTVATVEPHLIVDVRKSERNEYPVVKIGAQYWMGKNLNTVYYRNGDAINTNKPDGSGSTETSERTKANYAIYNFRDGNSTVDEAIVNRARYGLYYSYLAIGGFDTPPAALTTGQNIEDNLSPTGWMVPTSIDRDMFQNYIGGANTSYGRLRGFMTFSDPQQIIGTPDFRRLDDNITGFSAINGGYRNTNGTWAAQASNNAGRFWCRTYNSNSASGFNTDGIMGNESIARALTIRSLSATAIQLSDN